MCSERISTDINQLRWHRCSMVLECREHKGSTYRGQAFEVVNALLHGVPRTGNQCVAFDSQTASLFHMRLRVGSRIHLRLAMTGFGCAEAASWLNRLISHIDDRRESRFQVISHQPPRQIGLADLPLPEITDEWRLDFHTALPITKQRRDGRTLIQPEAFLGLLQRRIEKLFQVRVAPRLDKSRVTLLSWYWHFEDYHHLSWSQNKKPGAAKGEKHFQPFLGCCGPLFLRGDLETLRPWVALAQELHWEGSLELNPLGHFTLTDRPAPYLDRRLGEVDQLHRAAEIVLGHSDAAVSHARAHQGVADPRQLAEELAADLAAGGYTPGPYERFEIPKPHGGTRELERLCPRDLVAQQHLHAMIAPCFDQAFSPGSMAYRKGMSREKAADRVRQLLSEGNRFAVRTDIEAFFPSVSHDHLVSALDGLLPKGDMLLRETLRRVISAPLLRQGQIVQRDRGLAQGSPLSPLLANVLLDALDRHLVDAHIHFVRYADDILLLAPSRERAELALHSARARLEKLGLWLSADKTTAVVPLDQGFDFLGEHFDAFSLEIQVKVVLPKRRPLLVTEPYIMLAVNGDALDLRKDHQLVGTIPFRMISEIVVLSKATFSTALVEKCLYHGIPLSLATHTGNRASTLASDSRALRETTWRQGVRYHALSDPQRTAIAADFARAKIESYLPLVRNRYQEGDARLLKQLERDMDNVITAGDTNGVRGHEAAAAKRIFAFINREIIPAQGEAFRSKGRDKWGGDRLNAMLNLGYHLLMTRISGLIRATGLNPYWGYLHDTTQDYETLVYDVIEPFRVHADRLVLRLINRRQIGAEDFSWAGKRLRLSHHGVKILAEEFARMMGEVYQNLSLQDTIALQVENLYDFATEGKPLRVYRWRTGAGADP